MQDPELSNGSESSDKICLVCLQKKQTTKASVYCKTCSTECHSFHKVFPGLQEHVVVDADSLEKVLDLNGLDICPIHNKGLEFLCKNHNVLCCGTCVIVDHRRGGKVSEIKQIAASDLSTIEGDLRRKLDDYKTKSASLITHFEVCKVNTESQVEELNKEYDKFEDKIKKMMARSREKFEENISKIKTDLICSSNGELATVYQVQETTQEANRMFEEFAKHGDPVQKFICYHYIQNQNIPKNKTILTDQEQSKTENNIALVFNKTFLCFTDPDKPLVSPARTLHQNKKQHIWYNEPEPKMDYELVELKVTRNQIHQKSFKGSFHGANKGSMYSNY